MVNVIHPDYHQAPTASTSLAPEDNIERFGEVDTVITNSHGLAACSRECADVTRALHSISKAACPENGPGIHEVLFSNKRTVVVPAVFVEEILRGTAPAIEY